MIPLLLLLGGTAIVAGSLFFLKGSAVDGSLIATVHRGTLVVTLTEAGVLRPAESITYRSPLEGRELEITNLAPEGTHIKEGDLLVRFDATGLRSELQRAIQATRQAEIDLQAAEVDRQEAALTLESVTEGEGVLAVEETRTGLRLAEAKAARLREEYTNLKPLLDKGYITRDELNQSASALEEAEAAVQLARRKMDVLVQRTQPKAQQSAKLQLAHHEAQINSLRPKLDDARAYVKALTDAITDCAVYARRPGLVVYEDNFSVVPPRKVRAGDRVTPSQGLITLPDLRRMVVASSVREADVRRVRPGQRVSIRVDAFPDLRLSGIVTTIGALAHRSPDRAVGDNRFDLTIDVDATTADLRPEMNARVDILIAERPDVLMVPTNAVFDHAGVPICNVLHRSRMEPRMVEVGESSDVDVEIVAGLREGDRVALTDTSARARPTAPNSPQTPARTP
jgi:HlyD family secretion protein